MLFARDALNLKDVSLLKASASVAPSSCLLVAVTRRSAPIRRQRFKLRLERRRRTVLAARANALPQAESQFNDDNADSHAREQQSSWDAKDVLGNDYLYRLGKEASSMRTEVGAKAGMIDSVFVGDFLGTEGES